MIYGRSAGQSGRRCEAVAAVGRELATAGRFGIVGGAATLSHMSVVWLLIAAADIPVLAANFLAFLCAFFISFAGHYRWTFRAPGNARRAIKRFFLIAGTGFAANNGLLIVLLREGWLTPRYAAVVAVAIIPAVTFLASRFWGFRN